jgi:hypothetical protein
MKKTGFMPVFFVLAVFFSPGRKDRKDTLFMSAKNANKPKSPKCFSTRVNGAIRGQQNHFCGLCVLAR